MIKSKLFLIKFGAIAAFSVHASTGLPEPGLFLFGKITNASGGTLTPADSITWRITNGPTVVTNPATIVVVNGQPFHFTRILLETRSIGPSDIGQTPNTFTLAATPSIYIRSASLGTNACSFVNPAQATFTFSKADRGKVERVDLAVSLPNPEPPIDTDGDTFADWVELLAGTDPKSAASFPLSEVGIYPLAAGNGFVIDWSSTPGTTYEVTSTSDLAEGFQAPLATINAISNRSTYHDPTATGPGPFFYRIKSVQGIPP